MPPADGIAGEGKQAAGARRCQRALGVCGCYCSSASRASNSGAVHAMTRVELPRLRHAT